MKYKIGQKIKLVSDGREYEIIADKNTPYNSKDTQDPRLQNLKPNPGQDYLLKVTEVQGGFEPFKSVFENDIEEL